MLSRPDGHPHTGVKPGHKQLQAFVTLPVRAAHLEVAAGARTHMSSSTGQACQDRDAACLRRCMPLKDSPLQGPGSRDMSSTLQL